MTISRRAIQGLAAAGAVALLASFAVAQQATPEDKAVNARQGLMQLIVWDAGPLFAMAKGDMAYDAEAATTHAENLAALARYAGHRLFVPGTSVEDMPGETAALPAIWEDTEKFRQNFQALADQTAIVVAEAGKGVDQLRAAVGELGNVCGDCHETFRQKK